MAIGEIYIEIFKGIGRGTWVSIKPITVFIGANSSGKSSCIHALTCLAQTLKLPNSSLPLVLDHEYANVHLGRFIEVIHTKSYQDLISLGLRLSDEVSYMVLDEEGSPTTTTGKVECIYRFKCSQRTQDIRIETASIKIGEFEYAIKSTPKGYQLTNKFNSEKLMMQSTDGFMLDPSDLFGKIGTKKKINLVSFMPFLTAQGEISKELINSFYLGPFRESPKRKYSTRSASPVEVGSMGESAVTMLANDSFQTQKRVHIKQVSKWLSKLGLAKALNISRVGKSDLVDIKLTLEDGVELPIADLGYGLSQVMPVLTQCSFSQKNATLLFEQPEIHLHSKSSRQLSSVFIDTIRQKNSSVVLETHSPELVKQLIQEVKSGNLNSDDLVIYKVTRDDRETSINQVEIDDDCDVYENWEAGIST